EIVADSSPSLLIFLHAALLLLNVNKLSGDLCCCVGRCWKKMGSGLEISFYAFQNKKIMLQNLTTFRFSQKRTCLPVQFTELSENHAGHKAISRTSCPF
ncbi:MAG TPA: hypothetical protein P5208_10600, partial [Smithellaceae bacterium]|nr:hypothetical protein [Smithellaceae bacterium]